MEYSNQYKYTKDHEWVGLISDTQARVGITDHAQNSLGDIVYLDLPKPGRSLKSHEVFGVVESIKAVSDLYSPIDGRVIKANLDLVSNPVQININSNEAWMIVLESETIKQQMNTLMDGDAYTQYIRSI